MIMIFGPAGSGKSTQGKLLAEALGGVALSVGQICREEFTEYTKTAAMVPEKELAKAVLKHVHESQGQVVLDGQPWEDAEATAMFAEETELAIFLKVPREECLNRLRARGRVDDSEENFIRKLDMYEERIGKFQGYFKNVAEVDGTGEITEVAGRLEELVLRGRPQ